MTYSIYTSIYLWSLICLACASAPACPAFAFIKPSEMTIFLTKANVCWSARFLIAHVTLCRNLKKTQSFSLLYLSLYHLSSNIYLSYLQYLSNKWCLNPGLLLALFFFSSFLYKKLLNNLFMLTHLPIYLVLHIQFSSTKCH